MVTRPRLPITLFRVGAVTVVMFVLLALALVVSTFFLFFWLYEREGFGIGTCKLANVGTSYRRHRVVRGQGSNSRSR